MWHKLIAARMPSAVSWVAMPGRAGLTGAGVAVAAADWTSDDVALSLLKEVILGVFQYSPRPVDNGGNGVTGRGARQGRGAYAADAEDIETRVSTEITEHQRRASI